MSTTAAPLDDMSITVAPAAVGLVYKQVQVFSRKSREWYVIVKSALQFTESINPRHNQKKAHRMTQPSMNEKLRNARMSGWTLKPEVFFTQKEGKREQ